jgi:uncharacterized protein (DUF433 family)
MGKENDLLQRITTNAKVMAGKPIVRGYRITVEQVLTALAGGLTFDDLHGDYPFLEKEDIEACLLYAAHLAAAERVYDLKRA